LLAAIVAALMLVTLSTRTARGAPPPYLRDMPSPAQVEAVVTGEDAVDTAVRQAEALNQLCWVVRSLSQGGETGTAMTPEEKAQCDAYGRASAALASSQRGLPAYGPESWTMRQQRIHNDSFRAQVLAHFPKVKQAYEQRKSANGEAAQARAEAAVSSDPKADGKIGLLLVALTFGAAGVLLYRLSMPAFVRTSHKRVVRSVEGSATDLVPRAQGVVVEQLCLALQTQHSSYERDVHATANDPIAARDAVARGDAYVLGDAIVVRRGGIGTFGQNYFDFGLAVHNQTNVAMRVWAVMNNTDRDNRVVGQRRLDGKVEPGQRHLFWAGLRVPAAPGFRSYLLREVGVGPAGAAETTATTTPNKTLFDVFNLARLPAEMAFQRANSFRWASIWLVLIAALAGGFRALLGW
jgi:hypothetical protein